MILPNVFYYAIPLASVMFASHLGELDLPGATLANSWATVNGFTFMLSILLGISFVISLSFGHSFWAGLFSDSTAIVVSFGSMMPLLAVSIAVDIIQGVLSGVARGCGWQQLVVFENLGTFYLTGFPVTILLGLKYKVHAKGLWIGLICGLSSQAIGLFCLTLRSKWTRSALIADV